MRQPIPLRPDYDATRLRRIARESEDADQVRRLLALAVIYEGGSRSEAAEVGGVTLQVVRDWVLRFNAHGPEGLVDRKAPGQPSHLNDEHRAALATMIDGGTIARRGRGRSQHRAPGTGSSPWSSPMRVSCRSQYLICLRR